MSKIENAIPRAGSVDRAALQAIDPDALAKYVGDAKHPWWRRKPCVEALAGRVPANRVAALCDRIRDPEDTAEVRIALLDILGHEPSLEAWLAIEHDDHGYGVAEAILAVRGRRGDLRAAPGLAALAIDVWRHRAECGERGLEDLVARHGVRAVEAALPDDRAGRLFRYRMLAREGGDVTPAFADPDPTVARLAVEAAVATPILDEERLLDHVVTGPNMDSRLWAAYVLHRRGRDIRDLWDALDRPRIELPGVPDDIRYAILREHAPETQTDVRWLVEIACVELPEPPDEATQLARAVHALREAGLEPGEPREIGQLQGQGGGTYSQIELRAGAVDICHLGPYACAVSHDVPARAALERAGFRWIDPELGAIVFERYGVYYFGGRDPLNIHTLLFYWQD